MKDKKNFFFPLNQQEEEEFDGYDGPHAHLTNDWYEVMGDLRFVYWEKNEDLREETF